MKRMQQRQAWKPVVNLRVLAEEALWPSDCGAIVSGKLKLEYLPLSVILEGDQKIRHQLESYAHISPYSTSSEQYRSI